MRWVSALFLTGLQLATATRRPAPITARQAAGRIEVLAVRANGTLCPNEGTYTTHISPEKDVFTVGFMENWVDSLDKKTGLCTITVDLLYPTGCTTAKLQTTPSGFMQGDETVRGHLKLGYKDPRARAGELLQKELVNYHWSATNPGIVWLETGDIDGSLAVSGGEGATVSVDIVTDLSIETTTEDSMGGTLELEALTMMVLDTLVDADPSLCA